MLLAIDAGNTNTVFAVFDGETLLGQWRMATDARRTADEYGVWLLQLMAHEKIDAAAITDAIMSSSVVPQANFALRMLSRNYFRTELLIVGEPGVDLGIETKVDRPGEVGADRLVNALAAWSKYKEPLIIVDFGTATTFDVIANGCYMGGVIAPGVNLSLEALHRAAAKLPNVAVERPARVVGRDTVSAMQSGIYFGYVGLIEGIVKRIHEEFGAGMRVIATGGLAPLFAKATPVIHSLEANLIIDGLRLAHRAGTAHEAADTCSITDMAVVRGGICLRHG